MSNLLYLSDHSGGKENKIRRGINIIGRLLEKDYNTNNNPSPLKVMEGLPSGTVLGTVTAKDPDEGENGTVFYSLSGE